ncbi:error-prone DNA polymerase [Alcanivorax sp. 1008]|uniref:error-prone DNA polymerase n=1 Tax=Alcanivorax sp. 1008 TaxID=2816853 RepID=UPI00351D3AEA
MVSAWLLLTMNYSGIENPAMSFAELHCCSAFSFLRGASQPEELILQAEKLGYKALAITDECSMAGVVRAYQTAKATSVKLIIGSQLQINQPDADTPIHMVLLVPHRQAYSELCALISRGRRRAEKGQYHLEWADIGRLIQHCLCLWLPSFDMAQDLHQGAKLKAHFGDRLWIACELLQEQNDGARYQYLWQLATQLELPLVASNDVHMHIAERQPLQDVLTALHHRCTVQELGRRRFINDQRHLRPIAKLREIYPAELLSESLKIARLCTFSLSELRYQYPREAIPQGISATDWLRQLVYQGALQRWPDGIKDSVQALLEKELQLIAELRYEAYFLTVHDIVMYARNQNILCQGRGSAANSAVCYCLFITEVDPSRSQLLFERFISRERDEPPDIDVDFEHHRREEVMQYIYRKYGRDRAALTATVISYRMRSAVRDVGRALGVDQALLDQLSSNLAWWDKREELPQRFREAGLHDTSLTRHYLSLVEQLLGFPRHLSQHVGGFVITHEPLFTLVPVENAAMPDRTIIQWDKDDLESLGLMKVDVLALGMLTAIHKMLSLIGDNFTLQNIPAEDPATYAMLCKGDSVGVFQVESRAQMNMLPRLKPKQFYDLVIEVAIVRPGPIQGDMVHPYLRRRDGKESVDYPDERIKGVLERTLGVPIFQEQVIQLVMVAAGFSGGEADQLRRAMASWGKTGKLMQFEDKVIQGMLRNGYSHDYAQRIFEQMKGFGGYGFPESHAASFALLVYVSAWLKRHHPAVFYCGLLNSLPMGFYSASQLIQDANRHGIEIRPPDVDHSHWDYTLEDRHRLSLGLQPALRIGLRQIDGFNTKASQRIYSARQQLPFQSIQDLCGRANLNRHERECLVAANAVKRLSGHRHQGYWDVLAVEESPPLFNQQAINEQDLRDGVYLDAPSEFDTMQADYRALSLTTGRHPLALLRHLAPFDRAMSAANLKRARHGQLARVAGLITNRQRPGTASGVMFITLEDETGNSNVVVWDSVQKKYRRPLLGSSLVLITGTVERSPEGIVHLVAGRIEDQQAALHQLVVQSRNFH